MKQFEMFRLDISNECVWRNEKQMSLPPKPFAVLRYLVEHPGRLVTHDELLDALWPETYVQPQVLRTYMLELRKLLGDDAVDPRFIQTIPKRGYCFVAPVKDCGEGKTAITRTSRNGSEAGPTAGLGNARGTGRRATDRAVAAYAATEQTPPGEIVGRGEELERLGVLLEKAASGQRQVVFVTGDAGIGKTALVDVFLASCRAAGKPAGTRTVRGQCVEGLGGKEEYYPVMEALSQLCASEDGERACGILARLAPTWLGALGRDGQSMARAAATDRMPGEICEALEEMAAVHPLVLVFEDLHWGDDATVHLLSALARRRAQSRLMVVATYRPQDIAKDKTERVREHPLKELKHDLAMRHLCSEIALAPLAKSEVKQLLSRELKQESLPSGLGSFVHQYSGGNPLFVMAILEHLIAQGYLVQQTVEGTTQWTQAGTAAEMAASVPAGLAQMIEFEIGRLGADEQRLLEAGSLLDVAFPAWAVAAALETDVAEAEESLDALARRLPFVQRVGQDELPDGSRSTYYVFAHGMYREVIYQRQSAARLARRHIRIATRLGELFAGREASVAREMALHFEAGCDWPRAVHALRVAAGYAVQRQAYAEAEQLLEHGLLIAGNIPHTENTAMQHGIENELMALLAGNRSAETGAVSVKNSPQKS